MNIFNLLVFLTAVTMSRALSDQAFRELTKDEKVRLMDCFIAIRTYSFLPYYFLLAVFGVLLLSNAVDPPYLVFGFCSLLLFYSLIRTVMNYHRLIHWRLPKTYTNMYAISQSIYFIGLLYFFLTAFFSRNA